MRVNQAAAYTEVELNQLAQACDCCLIIATPTTLLIDLDSDHQCKVFERNLLKVKEKYRVGSVDRYRSRHGNEHVIVTLLDPIEDITLRLLLQAALGSDPTRELLSHYRVLRGHETPSVLFRPRTAPSASYTCPSCKSEGFEPRTGGTVLGDTYQGCECCTLEDGEGLSL